MAQSTINPSSKDYFVTPLGITVMGRTKTYPTITKRNQDSYNRYVQYAWVDDATEDPTVNTGSALYKRNDNGTWTKLYETESMDVEVTSVKPYGYDELVEKVNDHERRLENIGDTDTLNQHINNSDAHLYGDDRQTFDSLQNKVSILEVNVNSMNQHIADGNIHLSNEDRQKLDSISGYDDTELKGRVTDLESDMGVVKSEILGIKQTIGEIQDIIGIEHDNN